MFSCIYSKTRASLYTNQNDPNKAGAMRLRQRLSKPFCPHWASHSFLVYFFHFTLDYIFTRTIVGNLIYPTIGMEWPLKM